MDKLLAVIKDQTKVQTNRVLGTSLKKITVSSTVTFTATATKTVTKTYSTKTVLVTSTVPSTRCFLVEKTVSIDETDADIEQVLFTTTEIVTDTDTTFTVTSTETIEPLKFIPVLTIETVESTYTTETVYITQLSPSTYYLSALLTPTPTPIPEPFGKDNNGGGILGSRKRAVAADLAGSRGHSDDNQEAFKARQLLPGLCIPSVYRLSIIPTYAAACSGSSPRYISACQQLFSISGESTRLEASTVLDTVLRATVANPTIMRNYEKIVKATTNFLVSRTRL